jgi:uncharacterized protein (DUF2141 family)
LFHDENGNQALDTNLLGIPKEDVAFSHAKMKAVDQPCFEDCPITGRNTGNTLLRMFLGKQPTPSGTNKTYR